MSSTESTKQVVVLLIGNSYQAMSLYQEIQHSCSEDVLQISQKTVEDKLSTEACVCPERAVIPTFHGKNLFPVVVLTVGRFFPDSGQGIPAKK